MAVSFYDMICGSYLGLRLLPLIAVETFATAITSLEPLKLLEPPISDDFSSGIIGFSLVMVGLSLVVVGF